MRTLFRDDDYLEILARLERLRPESPRRWGRMTPAQAVCHLSDSMRGALGDLAVVPRTSALRTTVGRALALTLPIPWPRNLPTAPEYSQQVHGTPPEDFDEDVRALRELSRRFVASGGRGLQPHVAFGPLGPGEWGRWGYRHFHHHLRQFGV